MVENETKMETVENYSKENLYREARKLLDTLIRFGNVLVPSIKGGIGDTTAHERLKWLIDGAKEYHGLTIEDLQNGVDNLD